MLMHRNAFHQPQRLNLFNFQPSIAPWAPWPWDCSPPSRDQFSLFPLTFCTWFHTLLLAEKPSGSHSARSFLLTPGKEQGCRSIPRELPPPSRVCVLHRIPRDSRACCILKSNPKVLTSVLLAKPAVVWNFSTKGNPAKSKEWKE